MKKFFATVLIAVLAACATVNPSAQVDRAYSVVNAYVEVNQQMLARGRITPSTARAAADKADKLLTEIGKARAVLSACVTLPCSGFDSMINGLQPSLLELERQLREQEKTK